MKSVNNITVEDILLISNDNRTVMNKVLFNNTVYVHGDVDADFVNKVNLTDVYEKSLKTYENSTLSEDLVSNKLEF